MRGQSSYKFTRQHPVIHLVLPLLFVFSLLPLLVLPFQAMKPSLVRISWVPMLNSALLGVSVALVTPALAILLAIVTYRTAKSQWSRFLVSALVLFPCAVPCFMIAAGLLRFFGSPAELATISSLSPANWTALELFISIVVATLPIPYLIAFWTLDSLNPTLVSVALCHSHHPYRDLGKYYLSPVFRLGALFSFVQAISLVGAPLFLSGKAQTLATAAYLQISALSDFSGAARSALTLIAMSLAAVGLLRPRNAAYQLYRVCSGSRKQAAHKPLFLVNRPSPSRLKTNYSPSRTRVFPLHHRIVSSSPFLSRLQPASKLGKKYATTRYDSEISTNLTRSSPFPDPVRATTFRLSLFLGFLVLIAAIFSFQNSHLPQSDQIHLLSVVTGGNLVSSLLNTILAAVFSLIISVVLGVTVAWLVAWGRLSKFLQFFALIMLVIPGPALGVGWSVLLRQGFHLHSVTILPQMVGTESWLFAMTAVVAVYISWAWPIAHLLTLLGKHHFSRDLLHSARVLGASPWQAFRTVTFPTLRPLLQPTTVAVLGLCLTELVPVVFVTSSVAPLLTPQAFDLVDGRNYRRAFFICALLFLIWWVVSGLFWLGLAGLEQLVLFSKRRHHCWEGISKVCRKIRATPPKKQSAFPSDPFRSEIFDAK